MDEEESPYEAIAKALIGLLQIAAMALSAGIIFLMAVESGHSAPAAICIDGNEDAADR